ncbi:MAG: 1,4-alpha-glucan branching protein GlgB [Lachnospiraceae bacterium]|nr:1,4-alpha-glucan branching protein GlgB [Lachnospiraceae bacterium]
MNIQQFYNGDVFDAYRYFGAHPVKGGGVMFRTFAINAGGVSILGEFTGWKDVPMSDSARKGFYEIFIKDAKPGQMYKYAVSSADGRVEHCDPYGFGMELRPNFASIIRNPDEYRFSDERWMKRRTDNKDRPLNIFELHMGSFRRKGADENGWYRYDEIADELIEYVKKYHYTHVEFLPLTEHPFDGSWGYQVTGFFAPTSRYGSASQLKELIDRLHNAGIGAILDFVPAHFANDYYALRRFDGTELYEYPSSDVSESEWGSCNFIFSRREVASFMQSAANYWLTEFHFDGLRMDAVSRVIYWMGDERRGINTASVEFLRKMNQGLKNLHPTAMLIAEDSTSYPGCTRPVVEGGLGFDYKWDLGWMNDTLDFFMKTSDERKNVPDKLTFSMFYFYNERYLLPLSHDEVVHGKKTIIDKIFGSYADKFPQCRVLFMYMLIHPGKMLNFMGNEIAMFREWDEEREPDQFLLKYPLHDSFSRYISELWKVYLGYPALYELDYDAKGFRWITINDYGRNVYGIERYDRKGNAVLAIFNFSDSSQDYIYMPDRTGTMRLIMNSDWKRYAGSASEIEVRLAAAPGSGVPMTLAPFSGVLYELR